MTCFDFPCRWLTSTWTCWWSAASGRTCPLPTPSTRSSSPSCAAPVSRPCAAGPRRWTCSPTTSCWCPSTWGCTGASRWVAVLLRSRDAGSDLGVVWPACAADMPQGTQQSDTLMLPSWVGCVQSSGSRVAASVAEASDLVLICFIPKLSFFFFYKSFTIFSHSQYFHCCKGICHGVPLQAVFNTSWWIFFWNKMRECQGFLMCMVLLHHHHNNIIIIELSPYLASNIFWLDWARWVSGVQTPSDKYSMTLAEYDHWSLLLIYNL